TPPRRCRNCCRFSTLPQDWGAGGPSQAKRTRLTWRRKVVPRTLAKSLSGTLICVRRIIAATSRSVVKHAVTSEPELAMQKTRSSGTTKRTTASRKPAAGAASTPTGPVTFFGNPRTKKYHRSGCQFGERLKESDRVPFASPKEAEAAGYEACKVCRPDSVAAAP